VANLSIAKQHHKLAGLALVAGNSKKAAHHLGHAMNALRTNAPAGSSTPFGGASQRIQPDPMADEPEVPVVQKPGIRSILARFKQAPR
jgi:poly(3-hydroxybutyrate) depolymerase